MVIDCNEHMLQKFSRPGEPLVGSKLHDVVDEASHERLQQCLVAMDAGPVHASEPVVFVTASGKAIPTIARITDIARDHVRALRIAAVVATSTFDLLESLHERTEILEGFMDVSSEAMWCIEFAEPVDLQQNDSEIVQQIFNNERYWRLCNDAMARLYGVPPEIDIHDTPVSMIFPQSPANEQFVRQLIEYEFTIVRSPSIDLRHDGSIIYAENNVRGHIENGYLHRLWGTVRDITEFKQEQQLLSQSESRFREVLSALPDAVILVSQHYTVHAVNPAFERLVGVPADGILDRDFQDFLPLPPGSDIERRWHNGEQHRWQCQARHVNGAFSACEARLAPLDDRANLFVISVRPITSRNQNRLRDRVNT